MKDLIGTKFDQVKEFRREVITSGTKLMMEVTPNKFWGIGSFGRDANPKVNMLHGNNVLGWIIMAHHMQPVWLSSQTSVLFVPM